MRAVWFWRDKFLIRLFRRVWPNMDRMAYRLVCHSLSVCCLILITTSCTAPEVSELPELPEASSPDSTLTANTETPSQQTSMESVPLSSQDTDVPIGNAEAFSSTAQGNAAAKDLPDEIQQRLVEAIAKDLSQPMEALAIESATSQTWPDGCLGLATSDEFCTMALVDGWQISVRYSNTLLTYRSNENGTVVRRAK